MIIVIYKIQYLLGLKSIYFFLHTIYLVVKVSPLLAMKAAFSPGEILPYSFYRRLSGSQGQSGHEGMRKNLHPSDTRDRTRAVQPAAKRLAA